MPTFEYRAIDRQGNTVEGQVQAGSRDEAARSLSVSGLLVSRIQEFARGESHAPLATPISSPARQPTSARLTPPLQRTPSTTGASRRKFVRNKSKEKQLIFVFSQLASMVRSGLNAHQAAGHLQSRVSNQVYNESLADMSKGAGEGMRISTVMERYPGLYPPHVVSMTAAGEDGGFLPEALMQNAEWAEASYAFKRRFWLMKVMFIVLPALFPFSMMAVRGSLQSIKEQDAAGGTLPVLGTVGKGVQAYLPQALAIFAGGLALLLLLRFLWLSGPATLWRHRLLLMLPGLSSRAQAEAWAKFAFTYGRVSAAGVVPRRCWELACGAMPNLHMAQRMREIGASVHEGTRASTLLRQEPQLVPSAYADMVETGEISGDLPGSLATVARTADAEFKGKERVSLFIIYAYTYGPAALLVLFLVAMLYKTWYGGLFDILLKDPADP